MHAFVSRFVGPTTRTNKSTDLRPSSSLRSGGRIYVVDPSGVCLPSGNLSERSRESGGSLKKGGRWRGEDSEARGLLTREGRPMAGRGRQAVGRKTHGAFINIAIVQAPGAIFFIRCLLSRQRLWDGASARETVYIFESDAI